MVRVLIADDHEIVLAGVRRLCENSPGLEVVAEASEGQGAIDKAIETQPDIAIIDFSLPVKNGAEVARAIREKSANTQVLIYTMHDNDIVVEEVLRSGAQGYVVKGSPTNALLDAIFALAAHRPYFSDSIASKLVGNLTHEHAEGGVRLSSRERSVVQLIAEGYSNKQIGRLLKVTLKTVESHRAAIMKKLGAKSSADLVRYAIRNYLIEP